MTIDYTVIAKSVPEYSVKNGGIFTCTLGFCHNTQSIIRVYPIPIKGMNKWHTYRINVEKNKRDTRDESWKLLSYSQYENWIGLEKDVICLGKIDRNKGIQTLLQSKQIMPSIEFCNKIKISIAIIPINQYYLFWDINDRYINTKQLGLFQDVEIADWATYTKDTKEYEARIMFSNGHLQHNLQFNDWGVTEWLRKFQGLYPIKQAFRNLQNKNYCLIGNMNHYRNNWIALDLY
jgi:hypothetical protein